MRTSEISNLIKCGFFLLHGKRPFTKGYTSYRRREICKVLSGSLDFIAKGLTPGYGLRLDERIIEYPWLFSRLPHAPGKLLDAGSVLNYEFILSQEAIKSKKVVISTLAPENTAFWKKGISYIYEDLRETCFKSDYFDWIVSLSTLEHVGLDNTRFYTDDYTKKEDNKTSYLVAIREFHRILRTGGVLYLSLPYGKYKNHGWLQVFDSTMIDNIISEFGPSSFSEKYFRYDADGWHISSREDSEDATFFDFHNKTAYGKDYAAAARAVACLELVK